MKNICPHGETGWFDPKNCNRFTPEYVNGFYKGIYCCVNEIQCSFKDYHDCLIYEKKKKE